MEDMPDIFDRIEIGTTVKQGFDIYLVDDVPTEKPDGMIIHFKNTQKNTAKSQSMHELEILAKSGFLSLVGLTTIPHGKAKTMISLP